MKLKFKIPKISIPYEKVGSILVSTVAVLGSVYLAFKYPNRSYDFEEYEDDHDCPCGYTKGDAIAAISRSNMRSWEKTEAIKTLAEVDEIVGGHPDAYFAIEKIARADMRSWDKVTAIASVVENL